MIRLTTLCDYGDGDMLYLGPKDNNGEFDWWPVVRLRQDEDDNTYTCELLVVAPDVVPPGEKERARECCDWPQDPNAPAADWVEPLVSYGIYACVWSAEGTNKRHLMKQVREQLTCCRSLFGFYMDRYQNRLGATGWDLIRGVLWPARDESAA